MGKMRLVQRQRIRLSKKLSQRNKAILSVTLLFVISMGMFFNIGATKEAQAAGYYYSVANGEWSSNSIWSKVSNTNSPCSCDPGNNYNGPGIEIVHSLTSTVYNPLKISGGGVVNISATGKLDIYGAFELNGGSTINIVNSDSVIINGNLTVSGGSVINSGSSGYLVVHGNVTLSGGSRVVGPPGRVTASGTISGSGWQTTLPIKLINQTKNEI